MLYRRRLLWLFLLHRIDRRILLFELILEGFLANHTLFKNLIDSFGGLHLDGFSRIDISVLGLHVVDRVIEHLLHFSVLFTLLFELKSELHHDFVSQFHLVFLIYTMILHSKHGRSCLLIFEIGDPASKSGNFRTSAPTTTRVGRHFWSDALQSLIPTFLNDCLWVTDRSLVFIRDYRRILHLAHQMHIIMLLILTITQHWRGICSPSWLHQTSDIMMISWRSVMRGFGSGEEAGITCCAAV